MTLYAGIQQAVHGDAVTSWAAGIIQTRQIAQPQKTGTETTVHGVVVLVRNSTAGIIVINQHAIIQQALIVNGPALVVKLPSAGTGISLMRILVKTIQQA